jgi:hypothetical protein
MSATTLRDTVNAEGSSKGPATASLTTPDFSLVLGGPLYQLLRRAHLSDDALTMVRRRVLVISLVCWLPILLLTAAQGTALTETVAVPFLKDIELHIRFLLALPLLIIAELVVHERMRMVVHTFRARNLIPESELPRFEAAIDAAFRLRNSLGVELGLFAFVYVVGVQVLWRNFIALNAATWYATPNGNGTTLTIAGIWFGYVSLPIFQFLLCRWYFRIFVWARFLWQVSKIRLALVPTHPDRLGGLGFLPGTVHAFQPLAAAHGVMLAGPIASRIFFAGAKLSEFRMEALLLVVAVLLMVFGPLLVFAPQLAEARRRGMREYGTFAQRYVRAFDEKWLRGGAAPDESPLGSGDIQSLADLGNSIEVVRGMKTFPVTRDAIIRLAATTFAPILPLALTMMPFEELLKKLFGMIF